MSDSPCPQVDVLGKPLVLDFVNVNSWNSNRLPRWILLRAPLWGEGDQRRPGDNFIELIQGGGIGPTVDMKHLARLQAKYNASNLWTLVEVGWYQETNNGPHSVYLIDILVFDENGNHTSNHDRERAARFAVANK